MSETRTASILQRAPAILAITAHSYGLELRADGARKPAATKERRQAGSRTGDKPAAQE